MILFFQALTAFLAVVGLFEASWQITLLFLRKSLRAQEVRILVKTDETTNPAFLAEDLRLLSTRLTACSRLQIWLVCQKGARQEQACRYTAERNEAIKIVSPEDLSEELQWFLEEP